MGVKLQNNINDYSSEVDDEEISQMFKIENCSANLGGTFYGHNFFGLNVSFLFFVFVTNNFLKQKVSVSLNNDKKLFNQVFRYLLQPNRK